MTTDISTPENQENDEIQAALHRMEEDAWRQGQSGLEFLFSYLFVEIKFASTDESSWGLSTRSLDIDALEKALQREEEMIQQVLESDSFPWVKQGIPSKFVNAADLQPAPYPYADLIFVCLSLPHWVSPAQRPKLLTKLRNILVLYRTNNPDAIIVTVTKHSPFRLKDRLSFQWNDLSRELGGIGNKGVMTRFIAQQLSSPNVLTSFLQQNHTTQKLQNVSRSKDLQAHLETLQFAQTSMRLLIVVNQQMFDVYSRRIISTLRNNKFSKFMVIRDTELNQTALKKCDFIILVCSEIPEEYRKTKEYARLQRRVYRFDVELPEGLPDVPARFEDMKNSLENRYLQLKEKLSQERYSDYFQLIFDKYETYQELARTRYEITKDLQQTEERFRKIANGYFNLVESVLLVGTRKVHALTSFGGIMRHLTRYLIVDEFSDTIVEHLVRKGFPRHQVTYMTSMEFLQVFLRHKRENQHLGQVSPEEAYKHFIYNSSFFEKFEVVFINGWNLDEEHEELIVKVRLCMVPDEENRRPKPNFNEENLHEFLSTPHDQIMKMILSDSGKKKDEKEQEKEDAVRDTLANMLPMMELTPLAKAMARKKAHTFRMNQVEDQEKKLLDVMRSDKTFLREREIALDNFGQETSNSGISQSRQPAATQFRRQMLSGEEEEKPSQNTTNLSPEEEFFATILQFRLNTLKTLSFACGIRWLSYLENRKSAFFLETQPEAWKLPLDEMLEFNRVCVVTESGALPEAGIRAALPKGDYPERLVYLSDLPGRKEFESENFLLYVINCDHYTYDDLMKCLYIRNLSTAAPIPVLLVMSENYTKKLQKHQQNLLGHMAGIETRDDSLTPKGFPRQYCIESLEDTFRVKHLIRGILNIPPDYFDEFEQQQAEAGKAVPGADAEDPQTAAEAEQAAIQDELKDFDWSKFPL